MVGVPTRSAIATGVAAGSAGEDTVFGSVTGRTGVATCAVAGIAAIVAALARICRIIAFPFTVPDRSGVLLRQPFLQPFDRVGALLKFRIVEQRLVQRDRGGGAFDDEFLQRATQAAERARHVVPYTISFAIIRS